MDRQAPVGESPAAPQTKQTTIAEAKQVLVHFIVGNRREITLFRTDTPQDQLKDLFRSAAEAGARDILKLYNSSGLLMNINSSLSPNTPQNPYTLKVVAADPGGMLLEEVGLDVRALEQRVAELEKQLRADHEQLPPAVHELKTQVDHFRNKLETTETLSWLGFYKQLPEPLSTEECQRLKYRRKSDSIRKKVKENFYKICESSVTDPVSEWLRLPTFDSRQWEDEELLLLLQYMFQDLNFLAKFAIDLTTLRNFLFEVYKNYNDVPFHNFRHCFCVSQMMYAIACYVDLPSKIGDLETLILLISSICHDLDHPGYNNIYQINAKTELALRYNDISPLENHHCSVAFRILEMQDCNIFKSFTKEQFRQVREGMIRCILATDMARHNEILAQFKDITPTFDYSNKAHTNLLCMVLIKVADISNEARPMDVAEPWLDRLLQEFFKQSDAEKLEGLPVTPFMDRDKITKPSSQCSFIGFVLLPLFEALGELFTELQELIVQPVRDALEYYRRLNEQNKEERHHRKSVVADLIDHPIPTGHQHHHHHRSHSPGFTSHGEKEILQQEKVTSNGLPKSGSNHSVRSRKAAFQVRSRSRSTEEEPEVIEMNTSDDDDHNSLPDVAEDTESGDSETATEVEVSEKTLKFKISTEGSVSSGRKSYPGSRKGSRERGQYLNCYEVARAVQGEKDRRKIIHGGLSFDQNALRGKKLSFDTTELLDEQARRYFRQYKKVSIDSTSPDDVEKRDSFCASPKFEERRSSHLSDCSNQEERRPSILSPKNEERKSIQFYSSPSLDERRSSAISSKNEENKTHLEERRSTICTSPNSEKKKLQFCCPDDDKKLERSSRPSECTISTSPRVEKKSPKSYRDFCQSCLEATKSESSVKDNKRLSLEKKETQVCSISKTENNSEVYSSPKFKTPTGNTFCSILQNQSISTNETRNLENREPLNDLSSQNMEVEEAEKFDGSSELNERNGFGKSDVNKVSKFLKSDNSRPCETFINKQNNISAIMTDVCENSSIIENDNGNEGKQEEETKTEECNKIDLSTKKKEKIIEVETVSNSCKLDKISVDKSNKLVQGDTADATKTEEKPSPNGNRSLLARLKHFTDRLGFSIDKESNSKFMKHMKIHSLSFKNNNGRMTLPLRYRKKTDETCCKAEPVLDEQKRASTLPKLSKFTFGGKKNWKQRLLGKDRTSNSLDNIPPSSPLSLKASTSYSANNSRTTSPRKESFLDKENKINPICLSKTDLSAALEPDPKVLTTSIELM